MRPRIRATPYERPVRLSVSKVASVCGYHQFASREDLTDIFLDAVYQDESVRDSDVATLGAHKSADAVAALCSGSESERALAASLASVLSERRDTNVEAAQDTRRRLAQLTQAAVDCGTLGQRQARHLDAVLRSSVNTEHGTRAEDAAIKLYEQQTGRTVRATNTHLLLWQWPRATGEEIGATGPLPLRKVPLRARRQPSHSTSGRAAASTCAGRRCGCRRLLALDACRAAVAVERHEVGWWFRQLRAVTHGSARESDYRVAGACADEGHAAATGPDARPTCQFAPEAGWDAAGVMSDLRIARGRSLLADLREVGRQRQRLARALTDSQPVDGLQLLPRPPPLPSTASAAAASASSASALVASVAWWTATDGVHLGDYWHGGSRWDLEGLASDVAIERGRLGCLLAHVESLVRGAEAKQDDAEESSAVAAETAAAETAAVAAAAVAAAAVPPAEASAQAAAAASAAATAAAAAALAAKAMEALAKSAAEAAAAATAALARVQAEAEEDSRSSFCLAGAIDGMTDEEVPSAAAGDGLENAWELQEVVVEVKNRVHSLQDPPPFYDQVQLATYCLMLGVPAGELVQCVRGKSASRVLVTRVGLDDVPLRHGDAWRTHVLPRLYAFAEAVHMWRRASELRYAYLLGDEETRRALVAQALPHLPVLTVP